MIESYMLLRAAFKLFVRRWEWIYFYGAKGELMTDAVMNQLIEAYPGFYGKYSPEQLEYFKTVSRGKYGVDCSGFITLISGIYGNSAMIWEKCTDKTDIVNGKAGYFLYKPNHCAVDIGYGFGMDIGTMGESFQIFKLQDRGFIGSGALPGYNYEKAVNY